MEQKKTGAGAGKAPPRLLRVAGVATVAAAVVATVLPASVAEAHTSTGAWQDVIVTGSGADGAAKAVSAAGGRVLASLPVVNGVAARLPRTAVLGPDWVVAPQRERKRAAASTTETNGPVSTARETLGLPKDGNEGRGVTVAVVDTGIADVPDLAGRVTHVDVAGKGAGDGFGHGTFMAGLIAGSGVASGGAYQGVAPGAKLVDVKVADAKGGTDLITVLRGLQWVSEHAREVQVLNLSLSSYSPLPYQIDPLTQGLEALWRQGVTVVVPAGNDGPDPGTVTSPGSDPVLLTAGGLDESGTAGRADDVVAQWSARGPTWQGDAKPDLVAPGAHLVSLRSPGSVVDTENPQSRIGNGYFRGSGTSMATAVTSGVVAATLAVQPKLRPDAVKSLFASTAYTTAGVTRAAGAGTGGLDAARALAAAPKWHAAPKSDPQYDRDTAAILRDADTWAAFENALLNDDLTAADQLWQKLSQASRDWAGRSWTQLDPATKAWAAQAWAGRSWASGDWLERAWAGRSWAGRSWAGRSWAGRSWADATWTGRSWADDAWAGRSWAGRSWAGRSWADATWTGRSWAGRSWADATWTGRSWAGTTWQAGVWAWLSQ